MRLLKEFLYLLPLPLAIRQYVPLLAELVAYGLASAVALAVDYSTLLALHGLGVHYILAVIIGFSLGMLVAYALSVRYVFKDYRHYDARREFIAFAAVGVAGLLLSVLLMYLLVDYAGLAVAIAKLPVTACIFTFNFIVRRQMIFWHKSRADRA